MEDYPKMLPAWLADGYGYDDNDDLIRSENTGGPVFITRRTFNGGAVFQASASMTGIQLEVFEAWRVLKINHGSDWFNCPLMVGQGIVTHVARFVGKPDRKKSGLKWIVSAKIEVDTRIS